LREWDQVCFSKAFKLQCFDFLKKIRPGKNREIFGILQSHNELSARHLHNWQLFAVDNCQTAALRLAVFQNFSLSSRMVSLSPDHQNVDILRTDPFREARPKNFAKV
jgi:hypothetical protein